MRRGLNGRFTALVVLSVACGGRSGRIDDSSGGETGGSSNSRGGESGTGGSSGASSGGTGATPGTGGGTGGAAQPYDCYPPTGGASGTRLPHLVVPDACGWIDSDGLQRVINGGWYAFGDQYPGVDNQRCLTVGLHAPEECSIVTSPDPPPSSCFTQTVPGEMCTSGEVAAVLPCPPTLINSPGCPDADYLNMWGAGIAVDFNSEGGSFDAPKHPWDPSSHGVIGFSFEIDVFELSQLRVEVPMELTDEEAAAATPPLPPGSTTNDHPDGSPYWGASDRWPASPVCSGYNRVLFTDIHSPTTRHTFDPRRMLGIQFHVTTTTVSRAPYRFCIKNLTLLRE